MSINRVKQFYPILGVLIILALPGGQSAAINWSAVGAWALNWLRSFALYLILGLLAIWLIPKLLNRWSDVARRSPVKSFGVGLVILIAGYAALVILFVLLLATGIFFYAVRFSNLASIVLNLGVPATALAFGLFNLVVAYLSKLVVVFLIGQLIWDSIYPKAMNHKFWGNFLALLLGLVIYLLIRAIPWLGWAIGSVVTLVGLGAIWLGLFSRPVTVAAVVETPLSVEPDAQAEAPQPAEGEGIIVSTAETLPMKNQDQATIEPVDPASEVVVRPDDPIEGFGSEEIMTGRTSSLQEGS